MNAIKFSLQSALIQLEGEPQPHNVDNARKSIDCALRELRALEGAAVTSTNSFENFRDQLMAYRGYSHINHVSPAQLSIWQWIWEALQSGQVRA